MVEIKHKDFFGNEIKIGDEVAFMQVGYRTLTLGTVIKLTDKTCFMTVFKNHALREVKQFKEQVIVKQK